MSAINLIDISACILGVKKSGKSTLANMLLTQAGATALYFDTLAESPPSAPYDFVIPKDRYSVVELETVIASITPAGANVDKFEPPYRLFVIDEANRFCPPKPHPLPPKVADLNDQCRHYHMSVIYIARRPVQLNSDLIELADYVFIFRLTGKNDLVYLDALVAGLGDAVRSLKAHEFVIVHPDKSYEISAPVKADKAWITRADSERKRIDGE
jgi:hypothetical protein